MIIMITDFISVFFFNNYMFVYIINLPPKYHRVQLCSFQDIFSAIFFFFYFYFIRQSTFISYGSCPKRTPIFSTETLSKFSSFQFTKKIEQLVPISGLKNIVVYIFRGSLLFMGVRFFFFPNKSV